MLCLAAKKYGPQDIHSAIRHLSVMFLFHIFFQQFPTVAVIY
jgi:hypothetical protein